MLGMGMILAAAVSHAQYDVSGLATLRPGRTAAQNALWIETPLTAQFKTSKRVVVGEIQGPAVITMIHFAMPQTLKLNRDLLLRMYWDGETSPSVDCPLVDFFCDPNGTREAVNTALVNKRRGFNTYFPMPFRKSARIELAYDGPLAPGDELWSKMPCYSYVVYRARDRIGEDEGYFHASWRQETLLLGRLDYVALEARGNGQFVGWNVTVRRPGRGGYPVDENEKFYIDGETTPSIEFQGIEDSFGFSWGYPESESMFPLTGYFPFLKGGMGYRFFINDAIRFEKSLRVTVGFGVNEDPTFRRQFSKPGEELQLSSTVYWYQTEPHAPLPAMPPAADRAPAPDERKEQLPSADELRKQGVKLHMLCGRPEKEIVFAEEGFGATAASGFTFDGWPAPVYHTRAANEELAIDLTVPKGAKGTLRLYIIDPDTFQGGRRERLTVAGKDLGVFEKFEQGRWIDCALDEKDTADGKVAIRAVNERKTSNAVISIIQWRQAVAQ
jgi:hypothetical protein